MVLSSTPATASIMSISCPWLCPVPRPRQASSASAAHGSVPYPGHGKHHEYQLSCYGEHHERQLPMILSVHHPPRQAVSANAHGSVQYPGHSKHHEHQLPMVLSSTPAMASNVSISCTWFCPVHRARPASSASAVHVAPGSVPCCPWFCPCPVPPHGKHHQHELPMVMSHNPAIAHIMSISCPCSVPYPGHGKHHEHQLPMVLSCTPAMASIMSISCTRLCPIPCHGKHHQHQLP